MAWDPRRSAPRYADDDEFEDDYGSAYSRPTRSPGTLAQGLINTGNTCFMNSVVQSLASVESFHLYVYTLLEKESALTAQEKKARKPVTTLLKETLKDLTVPTQRPLVPAVSAVPSLKTRFLTGQQQDAHEFMSYLLDILETEELAPPSVAAPAAGKASGSDAAQLRRSASGARVPRNSLSGSPNSAMALLPRKPSRRQPSSEPAKEGRPRPAGLVGALKVLSPHRSPGSKLAASTPISPLYINGSKTPLHLSASVSGSGSGSPSGYVGVVSLYSPSASAADRSSTGAVSQQLVNGSTPQSSNKNNTNIVAPSPMSKKLEADALGNGINHVSDASSKKQHANGHGPVVLENGHAVKSAPNGLPNGTSTSNGDAALSDSDQESNADGTVDSCPPTAGLSDDGEALATKKEPSTVSEAAVEIANGPDEHDHSTATTPNGVVGSDAGVVEHSISPRKEAVGTAAGLSVSVPVTPVARPLTPPSFVTPQHDPRFDRYVQERKKRFTHDTAVFRMKNPLAGLMESTLFCEVCHRSSSTVQKILDLSLYTPTTPNPNNPTGNYLIEDCLAQFSQDEEVQGVWCEGCKQKRAMKKRLTIARAPEVLCIHLHRIHNVAQSGAVLKKTSTFVRFGRKLNLAAYSSAAAGSFSKNSSADLGLSPFTDSPSISPARTPRSGRSSAANSRPSSRAASRTRESGKGMRPSHSRGDLTEFERGRRGAAASASASSSSSSTSTVATTPSATSSMLAWLLSMFTRTQLDSPTPPSSRPSSRAASPVRWDADSDDDDRERGELGANTDEGHPHHHHGSSEEKSGAETDDDVSNAGSTTSSATSSRATSPSPRPGSSTAEAQPMFSHLGWRNSTGLPRLDTKAGISIPRITTSSDAFSVSLGRSINPVDESEYEYELEAVIVHLGDAGGGHYVMYRRLQPNLVFQSPADYETSLRRKLETINLNPQSALHQWLYISDHNVSLVDEAKVFGQEAYMLFYQKVQKPPMSTVMPPHR